MALSQVLPQRERLRRAQQPNQRKDAALLHQRYGLFHSEQFSNVQNQDSDGDHVGTVELRPLFDMGTRAGYDTDHTMGNMRG